MSEKIPLRDRKTFVFIDVSNIRNACKRSCRFEINFRKFYQYFHNRYKNLATVRYYEGIASEDQKKKKHFERLTRIGYTICPLERKSYKNKARYAKFQCSKCKTVNTVQVLRESISLKSNVDVFMATDMMKYAIRATEPLHIILVSCDGDFAETIHGVVDVNPDAFITILATPMMKRNNCLSVRLKNLRKELSDNMTIMNIENLKEQISQPNRKR